VPGYPTERPLPTALALNIVIGGSVGNVTADNFLTVQDSTLNNLVRQFGEPDLDLINERFRSVNPPVVPRLQPFKYAGQFFTTGFLCSRSFTGLQR
jgi:hypothetical protein